MREMAIKYARDYIGIPYRWGGDDFSGFDCSGYVQEILAGVGLDPSGDQTAQGLYEAFKGKLVDHVAHGVYGGCLVFFGSDISRISHVGFAIGGGLMLEAGGGTSKTVTTEDAKRDNAWVRQRPINRRKDFICAVDPFK